MFLRKSRSKTELFVILPNKPEKVMSPTNTKQDRRIIVGGGIEKCLEQPNEGKKNRTGHDTELTDDLHGRISKLMLVKSPDKSRVFDNGKNGYDIMDLHRKYEKLREYDLQTKISDAEFHSDSNSNDNSITSSDEGNGSPRRSSSSERKTVRFQDDYTNELTNKERKEKLLPISVRQGMDFNNNRIAYTQTSRIPILNKRETNSGTQDEKSHPTDDTLELSADTRSSPDEKSGSDGHKLEPRGILSKTLSRNPFNIKRAGSFTAESNFRCHECEKTFKYQSNLKTHVMTVHGGALFKSGSQKNVHSMDDLLICDVCSLVFKYSVNLRAHKAGHSRNKLNATI